MVQEKSHKDLISMTPKLPGISIKTKITFIIVTLIVCSLTIIGFIASNRGSKVLSQQAEKHLIFNTHLKAKEYNAIFSRLQNEIEGIAYYAKKTFSRNVILEDLDFKVLMPWTGQGYGSPQLEQELSSDILALQRVGRVMEGFISKNPYVELGYMATGNNVMVFDNEPTVKLIEAERKYTPTKRTWYIKAKNEGKTTWSQPYVDVNSKKLVVTCATPVNSDFGDIYGVVGFDILLETIQEDIISLNIGYESQAFLLAKNGDYLAKPDMGNENKNWSESIKADNAFKTSDAELLEIFQMMTKGKQGLGVHYENDNEILVSYAPLPAINASVGITVSKNEVMRPAIEIQKLMAGIWLVAVVVATIVGLMIGSGITKPINNLSTMANLISQGKIDLKEIETDRKDEIGVLIGSFNRLIVSLRIAISRGVK